MASTTLIFIGTARTLSRQIAAVQRMGLVPSGPRIVDRPLTVNTDDRRADAPTQSATATEEDHEVDDNTFHPHGGRLPQIMPAATHLMFSTSREGRR